MPIRQRFLFSVTEKERRMFLQARDLLSALADAHFLCVGADTLCVRAIVSRSVTNAADVGDSDVKQQRHHRQTDRGPSARDRAHGRHCTATHVSPAACRHLNLHIARKHLCA